MTPITPSQIATDQEGGPQTPVECDRPKEASSSTPAPSASFTPGPWYVDEAGICSSDEMVAQVCHADDYFGVADEDIPREMFDRLEANAQLIASAPELLDALQALSDRVFGVRAGDEPDAYRGHDGLVELQRLVRAAIAKATGAA